MIHWLSPADKQSRTNAENLLVAEHRFGNVSLDYKPVVVEQAGTKRGKNGPCKPGRIADTSTERASAVLFSCGNRAQAEKFPKAIVEILQDTLESL